MSNKSISISNAIDLGTKLLQEANNDYSNPKLESTLLLSHILKEPKEYLISHNEEILEDNIWSNYNKLLLERINLKPISQILGYKEFYSRNFCVNEDVLTPRPETEHLIDCSLKIINEYDKQNLKLADLGTGSGCIAVTLALESLSKKVSIEAYEISSKAISIATTNWKKYSDNSKNNISFLKKDLLKEELEGKYDLIVSNPPYIPNEHKNLVANDVLKWEPKNALFAEDNGLDFYKRLKYFCDKNLIKTTGNAVFELYSDNSNEILEIFNKDYDCKLIKDYSNKNRIIIISQNSL